MELRCPEDKQITRPLDKYPKFAEDIKIKKCNEDEPLGEEMNISPGCSGDEPIKWYVDHELNCSEDKQINFPCGDQLIDVRDDQYPASNLQYY